jgi:lipopolysaccharide export system protein LptC
MSVLAEQQRTRRQHFAAPGGSHDRLIRLLRVLLPAIVGMLVAILAVSPFTETRESSFLLAKDEVDKASERMRVSEALYRGEDSKGQPFSIRAGSAVQKSSKNPELQMNDLAASMYLDGARASILAGQGSYDLDKEVMRIDGPMTFDSGKDYRASASDDVRFSMVDKILRVGGTFSYVSQKGFDVTASNVEFYIDDRRLQSFGPVNGSTRIGTFSANKLRGDLNAQTITLVGNAQLRINQGSIR